MKDLLTRLRDSSTLTEGGCWLPNSGAKGYRYVRVGGKFLRAHRVVVGAAPGEVVLHSCDNPWCCNPEHLTTGSQRENMLDMNTKGRRPCRKLTDDDVRYILESSASGYSLAKELGVNKNTIYKIRKGETYVRLQ